MKFLDRTMNNKKLDVKDFPILSQEEYYSYSRGYRHWGQFINPIGNGYKYDQPGDSNFCDPSFNDPNTNKSVSNIYGYLSSNYLFKNLSKCNKISNGGITAELGNVDDLVNMFLKLIAITPKERLYYIVCDGGYYAQNAYIYREEIKKYERFTMRHYDKLEVNHKNPQLDKILNILNLFHFDNSLYNYE